MHRLLPLLLAFMLVFIGCQTTIGKGRRPASQEGIVIKSPNITDRWKVGTAEQIRWYQVSGPESSTVDIGLLHGQFQTLEMRIAREVPNNGRYRWSIRRSVSPGRYRIGIITKQGHVWGVSGHFLIAQEPASTTPDTECLANANTDEACGSCTTAESCEACGNAFVFSNDQCRRCSGDGIKVVNDFPENVAGSQRACVSVAWSASTPYGGYSGPGSCFSGPPWYFPASWVTTHNATAWMGYDTDGSAEGFNQLTARALEYYEWNGSEWVASCTCRAKHEYTGGSKTLQKTDCYYPLNSWSCSPWAGDCDWMH